MNALDSIRILLCLIMLGYASWVDFKTREIHDVLWVIFGVIGLIFNLYEIFIGALNFIGILIPILFSVALSFFLGYIGLFGGADVEALIVISVLQPYLPRGLNPLFNTVSTIYPLTVFSNSALAGASYALVIFSRNLFSALKGISLFEDSSPVLLWKKIVILFTGLKVNIDTVRGPPFQYPLELPIQDKYSNKRFMLFPDINDDETAKKIFQSLKEDGNKYVWVTNTLPFLFFITLGYIVTLIFGDVALIIFVKFFYR